MSKDYSIGCVGAVFGALLGSLAVIMYGVYFVDWSQLGYSQGLAFMIFLAAVPIGGLIGASILGVLIYCVSPNDQNRLRYMCPNCKETLLSPKSDSGKKDTCPNCSAKFVVPVS